MATPTFKDITEFSHMVNPTGEERIQVNAAESVTLAQIAALALKTIVGEGDEPFGQFDDYGRIASPTRSIHDILRYLANRTDNGYINLFRLDGRIAPSEWVEDQKIQCAEQRFNSILVMTWEWSTGGDVRYLLYFLVRDGSEPLLDRLFVTIAYEDSELSSPDEINAYYLLTVLQDTLDDNLFGNAVRLADVIGLKQTVTREEGGRTLIPVVQSGQVFVNVPTVLNGIGLFKVTDFIVDLSGLYDLPGYSSVTPNLILPSVPSLSNNSALRFYVKSPVFPTSQSSGLFTLRVLMIPNGFSPAQPTDQVILSGEIKSGNYEISDIKVPYVEFKKTMAAGDPPSDAGYGFLVEVKSIGSTISIDAKKVYKYNSVIPDA